MKPLFKIEKTFAGNLVALARDLTLDDLVIEASRSQQGEIFPLPTYVYVGQNLTLKQEHLQELIKACNISTNEEGRYTGSNGVAGLTDGWDSTVPARYPALLQKEVSYRGLRTDNTKVKRFQDEMSALSDAFSKQEHMLQKQALNKIAYDISTTINGSNRKVYETIRAVIFTPEEKVIKKCLNEQEAAALSTKQDKVATLEAEIAALREKLKDQQKEIYTIQRKAVTRQALKQTGDMGKAYIEQIEIDDEDPPQKLELTFDY